MQQPSYPRLADCTAGYKPIAVWHVCISGFRQTAFSPSGLEQLWIRLRNTHNNGRVNCELRTWRDDFRALAEQIFRLRPEQGQVRVYVYAYSWGAGWGFLRLAKALRRCGIEVQAAVLTDPVYRSPFLPVWFPANVLTLNRRAVIRVPDNVREVFSFHQNMHWPRGHQLLASDPQRTMIHPAVPALCDHEHMDELPDFFNQARLVASKALEGL